jgi:hypothetical protein
VVRAQSGEHSVWQRLSLPLPARVELTLPSTKNPPSSEPLPPLKPRR